MERGLRVERALSTPDPEGTIALASEIDQQRDCDVFVKVGICPKSMLTTDCASLDLQIFVKLCAGHWKRCASYEQQYGH